MEVEVRKLFLIFIFIFILISCTSKQYKTESEEAQDVVTANLPKIRECYIQGLKKNPNLEGKVVVEFDYNDRGNVKRCTVQESTLNLTTVEACICKKISELYFTPAKTGTMKTIDYPMIFNRLQ
jgi:hypothetical protein